MGSKTFTQLAVSQLGLCLNQKFSKCSRNLAIHLLHRSSHWQCFVKKDALRNFARFTGKHLCQSLFFNKVVGLRPTTLKMRLWHKCFPVKFAKSPRTAFFIEHLRWLPLTTICSISDNDATFVFIKESIQSNSSNPYQVNNFKILELFTI